MFFAVPWWDAPWRVWWWAGPRYRCGRVGRTAPWSPGLRGTRAGAPWERTLLFFGVYLGSWDGILGHQLDRKGSSRLLYATYSQSLQLDFTEMEFLKINLTKDSSLMPMLVTVPSTGGLERKPYSTLGFNNPDKKICEKRKLEFIHE